MVRYEICFIAALSRTAASVSSRVCRLVTKLKELDTYLTEHHTINNAPN